MNNNDYKVIHETALKTLIDVWDGIQAIKSNNAGNNNFSLKTFLADRKNNYKPTSFSSIARASSNLTLVFPVICSRNISIENASMVNKAIEKNAASMMQKLFASWQVTNSDVGSVQDYISQFHSNINTRAASLDDVFDVSSKLMESTDFNEKEVENALKDDMRNIDSYLPTDINETSIRNYSIRNGIVSLNEGAVKTPTPTDSYKSSYDAMKSSTDYFSKQTLDSDFKKANELMPTSMVVNFKVKDENGNLINYDGGVIGIKAKLYPLSSDDIVKHIGEKVDDNNNWLINFIRATTREISFMKDFVLALDKAKIDAMSLSDRKSSSDRMWKVLERRAMSSRIRRAMNSGNNSAAITTLVLSQEEVDYMRKNYNVDVERLANVLGLFDSLNLMCLVIVDESLEVAKFIYDEDDPSWETISFTHLERESNDNTYKRVVNLMTKISK